VLYKSTFTLHILRHFYVAVVKIYCEFVIRIIGK